jgi:hypothetical protein
MSAVLIGLPRRLLFAVHGNESRNFDVLGYDP